jgi:hypothetical protein
MSRSASSSVRSWASAAADVAAPLQAGTSVTDLRHVRSTIDIETMGTLSRRRIMSQPTNGQCSRTLPSGAQEASRPRRMSSGRMRTYWELSPTNSWEISAMDSKSRMRTSV